jgi:hypothetical protein
MRALLQTSGLSHSYINIFICYYSYTILICCDCEAYCRMSKKSGTNRNFNYFSYFYLQVKIKRLKMALTLDEKVWSSGMVYAVKIRDLRHLRQRITDCCVTVDPNV